MLNQLGLFFGCLCVLGGATLLYAGISNPDASQMLELMGGAVVVSLGLMLCCPILKSWLELRKYHRG